jgi:hypothetical protein
LLRGHRLRGHSGRRTVAWRQSGAALLFAGTNEIMFPGDYGPPTAEYQDVQNGFNQVFVNTVRATGGNNAKRHLVVQGFNTNINSTYDGFIKPADRSPPSSTASCRRGGPRATASTTRRPVRSHDRRPVLPGPGQGHRRQRQVR